MKTEKKRVGTKTEIRAIKNRERRTATVIFLVFILLIVILSSYFTYNFLNQPQNQTTNPASSQLKAAIVDHLSLTIPNQTFIETATNTLKQAGYSVDYYPGENVTVEFYRNLPTHGYSLIILRVHSALREGNSPPVSLFTSESYSTNKYVYEQLTDQVGNVKFLPYQEGDPTYFSIHASFIEQSMKGKFENTIIIMMGCNGLTYIDMAKAFIEKGAKVYLSWSASVSASHTDSSTTRLLQHFLVEKLTLKESVQETFKEVGFDPVHNSLLIYYPLEVGEQTIEGIKR
jgi:hypothetical protein